MNRFHTFHKTTIALILISLWMHTLNAQPFVSDVGAAYDDSGHSAHWSIYIPISLLVAGAIYFGLSDQNPHELNSSNTQDALGSIINSKRLGSKVRSRSSSSSRKSDHPYSSFRKTNGYSHS